MKGTLFNLPLKDGGKYSFYICVSGSDPDIVIHDASLKRVYKNGRIGKELLTQTVDGDWAQKAKDGK